MPDVDRVGFLLKLADFSWRDYSERRSIEWKINFALWLALGSFSGFMFQHQIPLNIWVKLTITALFAFSFLVYTFLWKAEIKDRNFVDKNRVHYYWCAVNKELSMEPPKGGPQECKELSIELPNSAPQERKELSTEPPNGAPQEGKWWPKGWPRTHLSQVAITLLFELLAALSVWVPRQAASN